MKKRLLPFLTLFILIFSLPVKAQTPIKIAGTGQSGYNGNNLSALSTDLNNPAGITFDKKGTLYFADCSNNIVRKIDAFGNIVTVAGVEGVGGYNGDGIEATSADLVLPVSIIFDTAGNLYIADFSNQRIRKVDTFGIITTVAGTGSAGYNGDGIFAINAQINLPSGVAFDAAGNMYITEQAGHRVRKVNTSGYISTVVGDGTSGYIGDNGLATNAEMMEPYGIGLDKIGNIYITDVSNGTVRKVNTSGIITTVAGTGVGGFNGDGIAATTAELLLPEGVVVDNTGNLYIADGANNRVREVNSNGIISTLVSDTGQIIVNTEFVSAVDRDSCGNLYFIDADLANIWKVGIPDTVGIINPQSPSVCNGQTITLVVSGNGNGTTYTWSPASGLSATTGDSVVATPTVTTTYTVISSGGGCATSISRDVITIIPTPTSTIQPQSPFICTGQTITLTVSTSGLDYSWSPSLSLSSSSGDSVIATPLVTTTYTVTGTDSLGCTVTDSDVVSILPAPDKPTIKQNGDILTTNATQGIQWSRNDTVLQGATDQDYTATIAGWYKLVVVNPANGCSATSDSVYYSPTGINQLSISSEQLSIYPNPSSGLVNIVFSKNIDELKVTNLLGQVIYTALPKQTQFSFSMQETGMYFVTVTCDNETITKKLVVVN